MKRRSTRTVTVFSLTSLVTTPCRTRLGIFLLSVLRGRALAFAQRRHDSRDVAAHGAHAAGVLQLPAGALEAQVELLLDQLGLDRQLRRGKRERLLGDRARHAVDLEHDAARLDAAHPVLRRALAGAH